MRHEARGPVSQAARLLRRRLTLLRDLLGSDLKLADRSLGARGFESGHMTSSSDDSLQTNSGSRFLETSQTPASVSGHADQTVTGDGTIVLPAADDCRSNRQTAAW